MNWEEAISAFLSAEQDKQQTLWNQGKTVVNLVKLADNKNTLKAFAGSVGCSTRWLAELRDAWLAFPDPEQRVGELSWNLHRICAKTSDPQNWLERALQGKTDGKGRWSTLSTRELSNLIATARNDGKEPTVPTDTEEIEFEVAVIEEAEMPFGRHEMHVNLFGRMNEYANWEMLGQDLFLLEPMYKALVARLKAKETRE